MSSTRKIISAASVADRMICSFTCNVYMMSCPCTEGADMHKSTCTQHQVGLTERFEQELTLKHSKMPSSDMSPALPSTTSTPILESSAACAALSSVISSAESNPAHTAQQLLFATAPTSQLTFCAIIPTQPKTCQVRLKQASTPSLSNAHDIQSAACNDITPALSQMVPGMALRARA